MPNLCQNCGDFVETDIDTECSECKVRRMNCENHGHCNCSEEIHQDQCCACGAYDRGKNNVQRA